MKKIIAVLAIAASGISGAAHAGGPGPVLEDPTVTNTAPVLAGVGGLGAGAIAGIVLAVVVVGAAISNNDDTVASTTTN